MSAPQEKKSQIDEETTEGFEIIALRRTGTAASYDDCGIAFVAPEFATNDNEDDLLIDEIDVGDQDAVEPLDVGTDDQTDPGNAEGDCEAAITHNEDTPSGSAEASEALNEQEAVATLLELITSHSTEDDTAWRLIEFSSIKIDGDTAIMKDDQGNSQIRFGGLGRTETWHTSFANGNTVTTSIEHGITTSIYEWADGTTKTVKETEGGGKSVKYVFKGSGEAQSSWLVNHEGLTVGQAHVDPEGRRISTNFL
jgi:hypothetical protein